MENGTRTSAGMKAMRALQDFRSRESKPVFVELSVKLSAGEFESQVSVPTGASEEQRKKFVDLLGQALLQFFLSFSLGIVVSMWANLL